MGSVVIVGCSRTAESSSATGVNATLSELGRLGNFTRIEPRVLDHSEVRELVETTVGHSVIEQVIAQIAEQSRGLPLFVREVAHTVETRGQSLDGALPNTILELLGSRIDELAEDTRRVLDAGALVGSAFQPQFIAEILHRSGRNGEELTIEQILEAIDQASTSGIVTAAHGPTVGFEFTHPLYSEVILDRIPAGQRTQMHAAAAELLESSFGAENTAHASELAWHFGQAISVLGPDKMLYYSMLAGQSALRSFAWAEALRHFENVRSITKNNSDSIELAHAWLGIAKARMTYESKWGSDLSPQDIYEGLTRAFDIFLAHGETDMAVEAASQGIVGSPGWLPNPELTERALEFAHPESAATARLLTRHADTLRGDKSWIREASDAFDRGLEMARAAGDIPTQLRNLRIQA
jgi:hypothetical protein